MPYGLLPTTGPKNGEVGYQPSSRTPSVCRRQRSILSVTLTSMAPYARICRTSGPAEVVTVKTTHGRPALAAKAAAEAPALPEELETTTLAPKRLAMVTAPEPSRSLNDQVGLRDSSLIQTSPSPSDGAASSGVLPSPNVTASAAEACRKPSQRHIEPRSRRTASRSTSAPGTAS